MDLLCGSDQKLCDMEDEMDCFLDNDVFQTPPVMVRTCIFNHMEIIFHGTAFYRH